MPQVTISDAFTDAQIGAAILLMQNDPDHFHARCRDEIVKPALAEINQRLGQDNDPDWLAYSLEYALRETHRRMSSTTTENDNVSTS